MLAVIREPKDDAVRSIDEWVEVVLAGEEGAWQALWEMLQPRLDSMLRRISFAGRMAANVDHRRTIAVEVMARLAADDFARLRRFAALKRDKPDVAFLAWLAVVTKRVAIDHLRGLDEYVDRRHEAAPSTPGAWREPAPLPSDSRLGPATRTQVTDRISARQLLALAGQILSPDQAETLEGWLRGETFAELAARRSLPTAKDAERLVRSGLEKLRRHARKGDET